MTKSQITLRQQKEIKTVKNIVSVILNVTLQKEITTNQQRTNVIYQSLCKIQISSS